MLGFSPPNFLVARLLFSTAPIFPLVATAVWAYTDRPTIFGCLTVGTMVGAPTVFLTLELLRWLNSHEEHHGPHTRDSE
jgi:hypothetical protein